jgi:hypothetical protein
MRRFLVVVALAVSGCAKSGWVVDPRAGPGGLTLAAFTADVDPAAGTITFRTEPTLAGRIPVAPCMVVPER